MHVRTEFSGSGENSSDIFVSASIELKFPTKCEGILIFQQVELRENSKIDAIPTTSTNDDAEMDYFDSFSETDPNLHPQSENFSYAVRKNDLR